MKCTVTVEHSWLQINSQMTFSQVAVAGISPLAFDFVKCIFLATSCLVKFYYFFVDVSTPIAGAVFSGLRGQCMV